MIFALLLILSFDLLAVGIALRTYIYNPRERSVVPFFALVLAIVIWSTAFYLEGFSRSDAEATLLVRLDFGGALLIAELLLIFFSVLFVPYRKTLRVALFAGLPISLVFFVATLAGLVVTDVTVRNGQVDLRETELFYWYAGVLLLLALSAIGVLIFKAVRYRKVYRQQIQYVVFGLSVTVLTTLGILLVLPRIVEGVPDSILRLSSFSLLFIIGFSAYSLKPGRILEFKVFVQRAAVYLLAAALLLLGYVIVIIYAGQLLESTIRLDPIYLGAFVGLLIALGYRPLLGLFSRVSQKIFYKKVFDSAEALTTLSTRLNETVDLQAVATALTTTVSAEIGAAPVAVYIAKGDYFSILHVHSGKSWRLRSRYSLRDPFVLLLRRSRTLITTSELEKEQILFQGRNRQLEGTVRRLKSEAIEAVTPIVLDKKLIGFLLLGRKKNGQALISLEADYFAAVGPYSATALNNALLFDEQKRFAEILKVKVREATSELRVANTKLLKLDKAKTEFLSIASHQLRSPMTSIKGYLSMLRDGDFGRINVRQNKVVGSILFSAESLIQLVNLFLDVSRIEEGRFELVATKVSLAKLVEDVTRQFAPQALSKEVALSFVHPPKAIPEVDVDVEKIRQVVINLIDNAVKYTPHGKVEVSISTASDTFKIPARVNSLTTRNVLGNRPRVVVCVKDTGIGLAQPDIDQLFQKFFRVEGATKVFTGGSGLGLFVVRKVIDLHGGELAVWSTGRRRGSTFCFAVAIAQSRNSREVNAS